MTLRAIGNVPVVPLRLVGGVAVSYAMLVACSVPPNGSGMVVLSMRCLLDWDGWSDDWYRTGRSHILIQRLYGSSYRYEILDGCPELGSPRRHYVASV